MAILIILGLKKNRLYQEKKAVLNIERKGILLRGIKEKIRAQEKQTTTMKGSRFVDSLDKRLENADAFHNIQFPNKIHKRNDIEYDLF